MVETTKVLKGRYSAPYRIWKIVLPYNPKTYLYAGAKADAEKFMRRLKKITKNPYVCKVKEITI